MGIVVTAGVGLAVLALDQGVGPARDPTTDRPVTESGARDAPADGATNHDHDHDRARRAADERAAARADEVLAGMSVADKVGQLLVAAVRGAHPTDVSAAAAEDNVEHFGVPTPAEVVRRHRLGGVIYFTYAGVDDPPDRQRANLLAPGQIAALSEGLQSTAVADGGVPLLIATDQEHGLITRTPEPFTRMPGPMALGAADDPAMAEASAQAAARELAAVGINVTFAPSADVNTEPANPVIGVRSPGASPQLVGRTAAAQIRGLRAGGVGTTAKHFPGHGSVAVDSHEALPTVELSAEALRTTALPPFQQAIDEGVDAVMPGHLAVPALLGSGRPATLSPTLLKEVLRDELGFDGAVVTDALDMDAITREGNPVDVALAAINAGADLLLMPPQLPRVRQALIAAVEDGRLAEERLDASVRRVLAWKAALGLLDGDGTATAATPDDVVGDQRHADLARRVASEAVTAIEAGCGVLPIAADHAVTIVGPDEGGADVLGAMLSQRDRAVNAVSTGMEPSPGQIKTARQAAAASDITVLVTVSAWDHPSQLELGAALAGVPGRLVVVSAAEPYDAAHLDADVHLAAYDRGGAAMRAVTEVLLGAAAPGRLPVPVGSHDIGHGGVLARCQ